MLVLRDEEALRSLRCAPDVRVRMASKPLGGRRIHVVPQRRESRHERARHVLVELDLHYSAGTPGTGRSSPADAAANAITARTCSSDTVGKSATISSMVAPSAKLASTVRSGTLVPRRTACPPHTSERRSKACSVRMSQMIARRLDSVTHHPAFCLSICDLRLQDPQENRLPKIGCFVGFTESIPGSKIR